ncbi:hypothetical protein AX16_000834 [Volvariella volvacea WC 439]|nr:hypothetical protein AX16_000834 [Volvariella volvacea WC 439]
MLLAALRRAHASPLPISDVGTSIPSPICIAAAALTASKCEPHATRSIFDIIYSSIGVILLCTYVSVHHNIPDQNSSWLKVTQQKLVTMLYALLAPEIMIMWALRQRITAGKIAEENKHRGWTRTHGFFIQMGGLMQRKQHEGKADEVYYHVVTPDKLDYTTQIPYIPEKEIKDHGKGDILAKAIVVLQTTWFVIQCIARSIQGLVLTEIELVALAFAVLNAITYGLWWNKPLNVGYPIYFDEDGKRVDGPEDTADNEWYKLSVRDRDLDLRNVWDLCVLLCMAIMGIFILIPGILVFMAQMVYWGDEEAEEDGWETSVHPFYAARMRDKDFLLAVMYASVVGVAFGAIHLIGWNFPFPTEAEIWLWQVCSLVLTAVPLVLAFSQALSFANERVQMGRRSFFAEVLQFISGLSLFISGVGFFAYIIARFVILFVAFFSLRSLPDSAYQNVKWTNFIPHI